jgi:uncharacterized membrane protein
MLRRVVAALRYAVREEDFLNILSAGIGLLISGTVAYALGEGWDVVDALYFAVSTLTTTSIADPDLVLNHDWMALRSSTC